MKWTTLETVLLRPCTADKASPCTLACLLLWNVHHCIWPMLLCQLRKHTVSLPADRANNLKERHCCCLSSNLFTAAVFWSVVRHHLCICWWRTPPLPVYCICSHPVCSVDFEIADLSFLQTNAVSSNLTIGWKPVTALTDENQTEDLCLNLKCELAQFAVDRDGRHLLLMSRPGGACLECPGGSK